MWVESRNSNVASFSCLGHWESSELGKKRCSVVSLFTIGISDCWAISGRQSLKAGGADFPTLATNQSAHAHTHSLALNNSRVLGRPRVENAFRRGWRQVGEVGIYHAACSHYSTSCFKRAQQDPLCPISSRMRGRKKVRRRQLPIFYVQVPRTLQEQRDHQISDGHCRAVAAVITILFILDGPLLLLRP